MREDAGLGERIEEQDLYPDVRSSLAALQALDYGSGLIFIGVGALAVGVGLVAVTVILVSFRQSYCPRHLLGRVHATMQVANSALVPLGTLGAGALGTIAGNRTALWAVGALFVAYGLVPLAKALHKEVDAHHEHPSS